MDQTRYSVHRVIPDKQIIADKITSKTDAKKEEEELHEGESRIEVRASQNVRSRERPFVRSSENPGVFITYNRCQNIKELVEWLENKSDERITAIVKNAYEVVRFEF